MDMKKLAALLALPGLEAHISLVNRELGKALKDASPSFHPELERVISGGKRLRPILTITAGLNAGGSMNEKLARTAAAVELLHIASLVHDDIIDKADTRHGQATINAGGGSDLALLSGDYLLAQAFKLGASVSSDAVEILADTFARMCNGQSEELADRHNRQRTIDSYKSAIEGKTAALLAACCQLGGLAAGLPKADIRALGAFGRDFGIAFQLVDDVLDLQASPEQLSKPTQNDLKEGVYTLPLLLGLGSSKSSKISGLLDKNQYSELAKLLIASGLAEQALELARTYNRQAITALKRLKPTPVVAGLAALPEFYIGQAL